MAFRLNTLAFRAAASMLAAAALSLQAAEQKNLFQAKTVQAEKDPRVITVVADPWMPYTGEGDVTGKKVENEGYMIELARLALEPDFEIKYIQRPWQRAINEVRDGTFDAAAGADPDSYPFLIFPEKPQCFCRDAFYILKSREQELKVSSFAELQKRFIGAIQSYPYDIFKSHPQLRARYVQDDDPQMLLCGLLKEKKIDLYLEDPSVFFYYLKRNGYKDEEFTELKMGVPMPGFVDTDFTVQPIFLGFSPANKERSGMLCQKLVEGMAKIPADKLKALNEKYAIQNPAPMNEEAAAPAPAATAAQ